MDSPLLWFIGLIILGLILLALSLPAGRRPGNFMRDQDNIRMELMIPDRWDERQIERMIQSNQDQPNILTYYIHSIKERFLTGQDIKTIQRRTAFLEASIKALTAQKEGQRLLRELHRLQTEEDIRDLEVDWKKEDMLTTRDGYTEIVRLDQEIEKKKRLVELEKLNRQLQGSEAKARSEDERKMNEARDRRKLDIRFKIEADVLKNVTTLAEIQRLEDEYTDTILSHPDLNTEQKHEQLKQLRRDCEAAKKNLTRDTGLYEED
jgi:hypothetical protein